MPKQILFAALFVSQNLFASGYRVVDQNKNDITILRAFVREDVKTSKVMNVDRCGFLGEERRYNSHYKSYNCAWELANAMNATPVNPMYHVRTISGKLDYMYENTPVVEIHTLIPLSAWLNMSEVGFSLGSLGGTIHTYQKNQTHEVQKVKLKGGNVGLVHRFVMPFNYNGGTSHCTIRAVSFKPFVTFVDHNTQVVYRNWDSLVDGNSRDYHITNFRYNNDRCETPNRIDRDSLLLE